MNLQNMTMMELGDLWNLTQNQEVMLEMMRREEDADGDFMSESERMEWEEGQGE